MILADTSAWVEYDRATGSAVDTRLTRLIADEEPLAVTEPVIMEVLAGAFGRTGAGSAPSASALRSEHDRPCIGL
jgi:predicted nucleic acid-binding protein